MIFIFPRGGKKFAFQNFRRVLQIRPVDDVFRGGRDFLFFPGGAKNLHFKISEGFANKACGRRLPRGEY